MKLAGVLLQRAQGGGSGVLNRSPLFFRILQMIAACLLFGHAGAYAQNAAASVAASPPASMASAPVVLPRTIPFKQDSAPASGDASPSLAAITLVLLLGLAGAGFWVWRKRALASGAESAASAGRGLRWWGATPSKKHLLLHGSTRLSPRHSVHEIEWRGHRLLIGCADQTMTLLSERVVPESLEAEDKP